MKKRFMPTIIAFMVLAMLLVYANYYETEEILPPGIEKPEQILACTDKDITAITWKTGSAGDLKLSINASGSKIIAPAEYRSDKNEVDGVLRHFAELKSAMVIAENATDTASYGFNASAPTVVIEAGSQNWELTLGAKTEVGASHYLIKKGDTRIFMVPGYIKGDFDKKLGDLRDRQLFVDDFGQVTSVSYKSAELPIELRLNESLTDWTIESPASYSADGVAVAELIQRMHNLRISKFVEDNPADPASYGLASPGLIIIAKNKEGREFALEAGEMSGVDTYVRIVGDSAIHAAATSGINEMRMKVNDFREKSLGLPAFSAITGLTLSDASGSITIEHKDGHWLNGLQKIADGDVKDFINAVGGTRVNSFNKLEKLEEYGLQDKSKCRLIELKGTDDKLTFWLGTRQGASLSVMNDEDLIDVSAELDDSFTTFMGRLRRPPEETRSVISEPTPEIASDSLPSTASSTKLPD